MESTSSRPRFGIGLWTALGLGLVLIIGGAAYVLSSAEGGLGMPEPGGDTPVPTSNGLITLALNQSGTVDGIVITPKRVIEDSRCPADAECFWAGRIRIKAIVDSGMGASATAEQDLELGGLLTTEAHAVRLTEVMPVPLSTETINPADYRFTFKVTPLTPAYKNASSDKIYVTAPLPGAELGKNFKVTGQARGNWYFEASFPIEVLDKNGKQLVIKPVQAQGEWMTTEFVPFSVDVTIPGSYVGPATLVLHQDNPSGLPENEASMSFPITIE